MIVELAVAVGVLALPASGALAQSVSENFSYRAPSGMFSEGTTKWNDFRFMNEDVERTARYNASREATGSIQGGAADGGYAARTGDGRTRRR